MENKEHRFTNKLEQETSPYLLQHAHNPVNWYPWGEEALTKAKEENKPILVSIGYAACHWCHVMERESFENEDIAAFMNENFVNIKVDREERPDIDHIYMDAVQVMTGAGGWPLNVFLTPDKKPFYGGTYFPPQPAYNRSSWMQILMGVRTAFNDKREEVEKQGDGLTNHIASQTFFSKNVNEEETAWDNELTAKAFKSLQQTFDKRDGGFGNAPKFPGTFCINFLLRYAHYSDNKEALAHALLSLDKMCMGGIYDQLGGGFARYSTDKEWLVPHFEKMLYDNALLIDSLSDAYKITGNQFYAEVIRQTLAFIQRELMDKEGGFYASLDADSEGVEGKFYCWDKKEIDELLKDNSPLFCAFYDVTETGNWEHKNILNQPVSIEDFAKQQKQSVAEIDKILVESRSILLSERKKRIRPALDDKIILSWNAMMCSAFVSAYAALGDKEFLKVAEQNMNFLLQAFCKSDKESFYHNYKNNKGFNLALLDDYALLIKALLDLYEVNFDKQLIHQANDITAYVMKHFFDEADGMFFYSSDLQTDLLLRKKEFFDGAVPSGNSVMAGNLARLALLLDNKTYETTARRMFLSFTNMVKSYPSSFANWLTLMADSLAGIKEVAIVGADYRSFANDINRLFIPNKILMASEKEDETFPLLQGKEIKDKTLIYLCEKYACKAPVDTIVKFMQLE